MLAILLVEVFLCLVFIQGLCCHCLSSHLFYFLFSWLQILAAWCNLLARREASFWPKSQRLVSFHSWAQSVHQSVLPHSKTNPPSHSIIFQLLHWPPLAGTSLLVWGVDLAQGGQHTFLHQPLQLWRSHEHSQAGSGNVSCSSTELG